MPNTNGALYAMSQRLRLIALRNEDRAKVTRALAEQWVAHADLLRKEADRLDVLWRKSEIEEGV